MSLKLDCYQPGCEETYMNQQQKNYFRARLIEWREQLMAESRASLQRIRTNENTGGDLVDESVKNNNRVMNFIIRKRAEETIQKINAALGRLDDGSYGYCLESGVEIGINRLLAYPVATLSIEAQELFENRQRNRQLSMAL